MSAPVPPIPNRRLPRRVATLTRSEWVFRFGVMMLLTGSLLLAWWSLVGRLLPLQKQSKALSAAVSRVSMEVDALDRKWPRELEANVTNRYSQARARLFTDQAALETWLTHLHQEASPLLFQPKTEFGKTLQVVTNQERLALIPAAVSLNVQPVIDTADSKSSPYERLLRYGQTLTAHAKRADLAELKVNGGTNSITAASLVFRLWATEEGRP